MRYALSNWIYGNEPLRHTFERLARFAYQGIELVGEPERYTISEVRKLSDEFGVQVTSVLAWCIAGIQGRDLASPDQAERAAAVRYGEACVDFAQAVGAPIVVVIPAPAGQVAPTGEPGEEQAWNAGYRSEWGYAIDSVRRAATYAAARGIAVGLEPINRYETYLVNSLGQALTFIDEVGADNLKLHLDTFHMGIEEPSLAEAVQRAGALLVNLHVSDSNREAPGRGHTDFLGLLQALREINYQGALTLEPVPPGSNPLLTTQMSANMRLRDIYAEEGINYLKQLEQQL